MVQFLKLKYKFRLFKNLENVFSETFDGIIQMTYFLAVFQDSAFCDNIKNSDISFEVPYF